MRNATSTNQWRLTVTHDRARQRAFCDITEDGDLVYRLPAYWLDRASSLVDEHNARHARLHTLAQERDEEFAGAGLGEWR